MTEQHKRCINVMLYMCLFQRYDFILTIKVLRECLSLLKGFQLYVHKYERVGPARAMVLSLCSVLIEGTCQGEEGTQKGLVGQGRDMSFNQ